jgi:hypothetical protein
VLELIQARPQADVDEIVRRIRSGTNAESIVRCVADGDLLLQAARRPEARHRYRFPLVEAMPVDLLRPENPYVASIIHEWTSRDLGPPSRQIQSAPAGLGGGEHNVIYLKPYDVAEVVDPRLEAIRPSMWTSVCADDKLMRRLFNLYFLLGHHGGPFFNKDYFLEDMAANRLSFCSPLLVNAVLAMACVCLVLTKSCSCTERLPA